MKIRRTLALALLVSSVLAAVPATAAVKVFLLAGQSNMAGYMTGLPSAPYNAVQPDVQYWNPGNTGWVDLQTGFGDSANDIGPEVGFGYTLHNTVFPNDDIYLVKYGQDSTSLAGPWNPNGSGSAYNTFKSRVDTAMANLAGQSPTIAGMIWMQGEQDAANASFAAAYAANLTSFITKVRTDFSTPDMSFVVGRITDLSIYPPTFTPAAVAQVRTAQETVPDQVGNASWINTDDLEMNPNAPGHYIAAGSVALGTQFANEFAVRSEPVPVYWTGVGGTTWSTATGLNNWKNSGGTPANFINSAPVTFDDAATGITVDISAADLLPTSVTFNNSSKNFTIAGTKGIAGTTGVVKQGTAMVTLNSDNAYTGMTTVEAGTLRLGTAAQDPVLSGAGGADLQGGKIWFDYTTSSPATTIANLLAASYHDGAWDVGQFKNTTADTTGLSLGWIDNATGKKVVVMATCAGDADLSGTVDVSDLTLLLNNYNKPGMVWSNGDFNYDGAVNVADLTALLNNYNRTMGLSIGTPVPEPTTLSVLTGSGLMLAAWACRRIRHQRKLEHR